MSVTTEEPGGFVHFNSHALTTMTSSMASQSPAKLNNGQIFTVTNKTAKKRKLTNTPRTKTPAKPVAVYHDESSFGDNTCWDDDGAEKEELTIADHSYFGPTGTVLPTPSSSSTLPTVVSSEPHASSSSLHIVGSTPSLDIVGPMKTISSSIPSSLEPGEVVIDSSIKLDGTTEKSRFNPQVP